MVDEKNKTILGDCIQVLPGLQSESVDMILSDLPYDKTALEWDKPVHLEKLWREFKRIIKPHGAIVLFGCEPFSSLLRCSNLEMYKYDFVWDKSNTTNYTNAKKMPLRRHENIMVFYKMQPTYNPQFEILKKNDPRLRKNGRGHNVKLYENTVYGNIQELKREETGKRHPNTILKFSNSNRKGKIHPTQKPVALYEYLIKTFSDEGDFLLDCFAGSGTLGEACFNLNRNYLMIEKDPDYFNLILAREKSFKSNQ